MPAHDEAPDLLGHAAQLERDGWRRYIAGIAFITTAGVGVAALSGLSELSLFPRAILPGTFAVAALFAVGAGFLVAGAHLVAAAGAARRQHEQDRQAAAEPAPATPISDLADLGRLPGERPTLTAGFTDGADWKAAVGRAGRRPSPRHRGTRRPTVAEVSAGADVVLANVTAAIDQYRPPRRKPTSEQDSRWLTASFPLGGPEDVR